VYGIWLYDSQNLWASNSVIEKVLPGNCVVANPVPIISSLSPSSLSVGSAGQTLTITGSGFLASSTVSYNTVVHPAAFLSASQLTILLSSTDLATIGTYPVIVTNPTPGGGTSNTVNFVVSAGRVGAPDAND
jgi:hypothetical protein